MKPKVCGSLAGSILPALFQMIISAIIGVVIGVAAVKRDQDRCCNKTASSVSCCSKCTCLKCEQVSD